MTRGPLFQELRPQFSGHETFPLRYGWLTKVVHELHRIGANGDARSVFTDSSAIARFGVGKNMVASMRHWANAVGVISEQSADGRIEVTPLGQMLFGRGGVDPYLESHATLWMLHWQLTGKPRKTTWHWAFNYFPTLAFEREHLLKGLEQLIAEKGWKRIAPATIKRDVDCFIRTYAPRLNAAHSSDEDTLECPLTELGLIQQVGRRDGFRFVRNAKPTLTEAVFRYALTDFWQSFSSGRTLSLEACVYEPGSPGRTFLLEEEDVAERLKGLEESSQGVFRWSETAGLRQIMIDKEPDLISALAHLSAEMGSESAREAA